MVPETILTAALDLLTLILGAIPDVTLPFGTYPEDFAELVGSALGTLDSVVPVSEAALVVGWFLVSYVPIVVVFIVVRWTYEHAPIIGNGG